MGCNVLGNTQLFLNTLDWEFIIEKKKVNLKLTTLLTKKKELGQENTHLSKKASTKKITCSRKHALNQKSVHERRTRSRKNDNGQESNQETKLTKLSVKKIKERFK